MKNALKILAGFFIMLTLAVLIIILLMPWMDRWGATDAEIKASFIGDQLVPDPRYIYTRAITIQAAPEQVYPWIVQLGAERGGMYSYTWFETYILQCELVNADRIHPEWQDIKVGDQIKMCPGDSGPPPYEVALLEPDNALVLGHMDNGQWVDVWQFILVPQSDGTTRLVLRSRDTKSGWIWDVIRPGEFIMSRGMLLGIRERAENPALLSVSDVATPTPEVFNPLDPSPTPSGSDLPLNCQVTDLNVYIDRNAGYCYAYPLRFTVGEQPWFAGLPGILGPALDSSAEPIHATLVLEVTSFDPQKSLDQQADEFLKNLTVVDLATLKRTNLTVAGEPALQVDAIPVQLSWRIIFVSHANKLYRLMYWPVDITDAQKDLDELFQTTLNTFSFIDSQ